MVLYLSREKRQFPFVVPFLLVAQTTALFPTGSSPAIQDPLINPPSTICPVAQDGATSNTFPWSVNPICVHAILPSEIEPRIGIKREFCVYTNTAFNSGRGFSLVTTPEVAAELTNDVSQQSATTVSGNVSWEMKEIEGKGKGLLAKRAIEAGETLILKSPVLFVSREVLSLPSRQRKHLLLEKAVGQLPEKTGDMVLALSRRGGEGVIEDVINVNAVRTKVWEGTPHLVVVPEVARINHACRPNTAYRFNDHTLNFDVFALKPIKPNEELTYIYGFSQLPHNDRLAALKSTWGFTCTCPLCTASSTNITASNSRLQEIHDLKTALPSSPTDMPQFLGLLPNLITLLEEEDLSTELAMYEEILAYTWSSLGIAERAVYWGERARRHWGIMAGKESWEEKRLTELVTNIEGHFTWMSYEGDPWEGVGKGHPWDGEGHRHDHGDGHDHEH